MKADTETVIRIREIKERNPHQNTDEMIAMYAEDPSGFEAAIVHLVQSHDPSDRRLGLRVAESNKVQIPSGLVSECLEADTTRERASFYIWRNDRREFLPRMNELLIEGKSGVIQMIMAFGDESSRFVLEKVYTTLIENNPSRLGRYQILQAKWAADATPNVINRLPKKTTGIYLPKTSQGDTFPSLQIPAPSCKSCGKPMVCLFRLPKEADTLQMPVFHCERCSFDDAVFIDFGLEEPQWIGEAHGMEQKQGHYSNLKGGVVAWGVQLESAKNSRTFIGGDPDWEQDEVKFVCPKCGVRMEFVVQMESDYAAKTRLHFSYGGTMYVHRCGECQVACYFFQAS